MHPLELKMEYPVKNDCVRWCNATCCNWGQRMPTYDQQNNIVGSPTPLWINPSKTFYVLFFIINILVSILFVSSFVAITFYNNSQLSLNATGLNNTNGTNSTLANSTNSNTTTNTTTNSTNTTASNGTTLTVNDLACLNTITSRLGTFFIVIGSVILFLNGFYNMFLYMLDYATDEEWYRYLTFKFILLLFLAGFDVADYLWCIDNIKYYAENSGTNQLFTKTGVSVCPTLFNFNLYANMIVSVLITVICLFQAFKTCANYKELFYPKDQEEYRARCDDPDIIILGKN